RAAAGVTRTLSITETRLRYGREAISRSNQPALNSYTLALAAPRNRDPPDSAQRGILVNLREVSGRHPGGPDPSMAQGPRRDGHLSGIRFPRQECLVALSADAGSSSAVHFPDIVGNHRRPVPDASPAAWHRGANAAAEVYRALLSGHCRQLRPVDRRPGACRLPSPAQAAVRLDRAMALAIFCSRLGDLDRSAGPARRR